MDGRRKALIVANDRYEHAGLRQLLSPGADADALSGVLGDPEIGGFEVQVVHNEPAHVISSHIEDLFSDSRPDDVLLLHFSCHGLKNESGELFFAASNTRPHRLGSTAVAASFVQGCMRSSRSRSIVLLLDCCYGGAFGEGVTVRAAGDAHVLDSFPGGNLGGGRGRAVITASSSIEYAFEGDRLADETTLRPSVFTSTLVEGMATGDADRDEDGWISLNELYDYVFDRVREKNPHQTPGRDVEMQGELYLARSRRRRIRPQPIPADLRAATTDANMYSRLGAVIELRSRLTSDNLPVAVGACDALREIASTDIRYVAEAATAALEEASIRPSETELHFGEVAVGSDPGSRVLRFLGPPIARACTVQPSESWIRVATTEGGVVVSVTPNRPGTHNGVLTVSGPTGEVPISVDVHVTEPAPPLSEPATSTPSSGRDEPQPVEPASPVDGTPPPSATASKRPAVRSAPAPQPPPTSGAAPVEPASSDHWSSWSHRTAMAMLVAGGLTVLFGLILSTVDGDEAKLTTITIQIVVYAAVSILLACAPGEASRTRRIILAVLAGWALLGAGWLIVTPPLYLEYWKIPETPLYLFWPVAGALEIGAALVGPARPTRRLELVSGALSVVLGAVIIYLVDQQANWWVASFSLYFIALGTVWILIGITRRRAIRATDASEAALPPAP